MVQAPSAGQRLVGTAGAPMSHGTRPRVEPTANSPDQTDEQYDAYARRDLVKLVHESSQKHKRLHAQNVTRPYVRTHARTTVVPRRYTPVIYLVRATARAAETPEKSHYTSGRGLRHACTSSPAPPMQSALRPLHMPASLRPTDDMNESIGFLSRVNYQSGATTAHGGVRRRAGNDTSTLSISVLPYIRVK